MKCYRGNASKQCVLGKGVRCGQMSLLFSHVWEIATPKKDIPADEIDRAKEDQMEKNNQITG